MGIPCYLLPALIVRLPAGRCPPIFHRSHGRLVLVFPFSLPPLYRVSYMSPSLRYPMTMHSVPRLYSCLPLCLRALVLVSLRLLLILLLP